MELAPELTRPAVLFLRWLCSGLTVLEGALVSRTEVPVPLRRVKLPRSGRRVEIELRGAPGRDVILGGVEAYEPTTIALWRKLTRGADVVLDIGANYGLFAILAADENLTSSVYAFEPLPEVLGPLRRNVDSSGYGDRITVAGTAVSDSCGTAEFVVKGTSGSTLAAGFWVEKEPLPRIRVETVTIDEWCRSAGVVLTPLSVVKMDIETHEPTALRGGAHLLEKGPAIVCEVLGTFVEEALSPFFPPDRWEYWWIGPDGPALRRRIIGDPSWRYANYVFVTRDSPYRKILTGSGATENGEGAHR
jgi:FkbM family methyltransferase